MKKLVLGFLALTSLSAFADCTVSFSKPRDGAMSSSYISESTYIQLKEILSEKGYIVLSAEEQEFEAADYNLDVRGYYGYGCGTGLTFKDYLTVPAYNSVELSGPDGLKISIEKSFSSPVGVRKIAKRHLMKTVRALPECARRSSFARI